MGRVRLTSDGYANTGYSVKTALTGVTVPYLPMVIQLIIKTPPPPLYLLINPQSMNMNFSKKITPSKTRANTVNRGYIFQHHHDELDIMSCNGITAMGYSTTYGLTSSDMRNTASWDNWQKLLATFRNNGVNLNTRDQSIIDTVGRVAISYDRIVYYGSFDSLSWQHSQENPYHYTFNWSFTVTKTVDNNVYPRYVG